MTNEAKASWIFGSLFALFLLGVFVFGPPSLPGYKQQILAYICATLAAFFAIFFTGTLLVNAQLPIPGKWTVRSGAAFALFLVVLFWWRSDASPIVPQKDQDPLGSGEGRASKIGDSAPAASIPPLVKGGAPIGTTFQSIYTRNDGSIRCADDYTKVSATKWHEQPEAGSRPECLGNTPDVWYTERESDNSQYILLYDEGRSLFARFSNTEVGQSGATSWRLISKPTWNEQGLVTRVK